jgi:hypothetical protein
LSPLAIPPSRSYSQRENTTFLSKSRCCQ